MVDVKNSVQVRLRLDVGQKAPTPAIASVLGSRGVNIMKFLQEFNALVKGFAPGCRVGVIADIFKDKKFKIDVRGPSVADLLKEAAKLSKGSSEPGKVLEGVVTKDQIRKIAEGKMKVMHARNVEGVMKMVMGTARSMGMRVSND